MQARPRRRVRRQRGKRFEVDQRRRREDHLEETEGRSIRAKVGVESKGVRSGVERRRGRGLKGRDPGRRDTPGEKVLKERRSPRRRGRMGTSVQRHRVAGGRPSEHPAHLLPDALSGDFRPQRALNVRVARGGYDLVVQDEPEPRRESHRA
eukprot:29442-Pelagococcus_subviridis.AAC.12